MQRTWRTGSAFILQPSREIRRGDFSLAPFRRSDNRRALWQLLTTLVPTALLWTALPWLWRPLRPDILLIGPVLALLVLFSARSFSLSQRPPARLPRGQPTSAAGLRLPAPA
ncbi:MAG: hypothetical protein ACKO5M_09555 [Vulcanococcus sp.]